jgi:hypothetical protein
MRGLLAAAKKRIVGNSRINVVATFLHWMQAQGNDRQIDRLQLRIESISHNKNA